MRNTRASDKTLEMTKVFGRYVFEHPDFLERLPDRATLVFLDPADPRFNQEARGIALRNRRLAEESGEDVGPLVYIEVKMTKETIEVPNFEVEVAAGPTPNTPAEA